MIQAIHRMNTMIFNELMILVRDSSTLFWIILFPFFFLFMMLFTYGSDFRLPTQKIEIVDLDNSALSARYINLVKTTFSAKESIAGALSRVSEATKLSDNAVRITIPDGFAYALERGRETKVKFSFAQDGMAAQLAMRVVRALTVRFNSDVAGTPDLANVEEDDSHAKPALSFTHYTLTGTLVMSMMSAGMTTICIALAYRRERNGFKTLACLPLSPSSFMLSMLLARMLVLCSASFLLLFGARALFDIPLVLSASRLSQAGVVILLGGAMLLAMGTAMAARLATVSSATFISSLVYIGLLFLSDLTMPLNIMSPKIAAILSYLPTTQFVNALRHVLVMGQGLGQQYALLIGMACWTLLFSLIAVGSFRWHRQ